MSNDSSPMNQPPPSEEEIVKAAAAMLADERGSYQRLDLFIQVCQAVHYAPETASCLSQRQQSYLP